MTVGTEAGGAGPAAPRAPDAAARAAGAAAILPLLLILVGFEIGVTFFSALLPQVQQEFGLSAGTVALALSVYHGVRLLFNVPAGRLIARSPSLTRLLVVGGALLAAGAAVVAAAPGFGLVLAGRLIMGIGSALFFLTTQFWISKAASRETKAILFSYNQLAALTGSALGPALGGAVAGWISWRAAMALTVAAGLIAVAAGRRLADPLAQAPPAQHATAPGEKLHLSAVLGPGLIMLALFFFHGGVGATLIPLFSARRLGLGPAAIGGVLMLMTVWRFGSALAGGRLAAVVGTRPVALAGLAALGLAVLSLLPVDTPAELLAAVTLLSWVNLGGSMVVALITDLVPEPHWGTALGLNRTLADIGAMIAPLVVGFAIDRHGFAFAIVLVAAVLLACAAAAALLIAPGHAPA